MKVTIKLKRQEPDNSSKSNSTALEKFKIENADLLTKAKKQYDNLSAILNQAIEGNAQYGKPNAFTLKHQPEFLAGLYKAALEMKLTLSILYGLLSKDDELMASEDILEDLFDICNDAAGVLDAFDCAFDELLFGDGEDQCDAASDNGKTMPSFEIEFGFPHILHKGSTNGLTQNKEISKAIHVLIDLIQVCVR